MGIVASSRNKRDGISNTCAHRTVRAPICKGFLKILHCGNNIPVLSQPLVTPKGWRATISSYSHFQARRHFKCAGPTMRHFPVRCTYVTIAIKEIIQGDAGLNSKPYVLQLVRVIYRSTFKLFELKLLNLSCMHGCMTLRPICKKAASIEVVFLNDLLKIITEHSRIIQRDGGGRWSDG